MILCSGFVPVIIFGRSYPHSLNSLFSEKHARLLPFQIDNAGSRAIDDFYCDDAGDGVGPAIDVGNDVSHSLAGRVYFL
jgi:hypothetical protein